MNGVTDIYQLITQRDLIEHYRNRLFATNADCLKEQLTYDLAMVNQEILEQSELMKGHV